jgi:hypothetical protein
MWELVHLYARNTDAMSEVVAKENAVEEVTRPTPPYQEDL